MLLAVDDAIGTVPYALLGEQEDTEGYLLLFQGVIPRRGIPLGVYTDRHAVFQHWRHELEEAPSTSADNPSPEGRALRAVLAHPAVRSSGCR